MLPANELQPSDFVFPAGATAPLAERVNHAFAMHPERERLRPYSFVLDTFVRATPPPRAQRLDSGGECALPLTRHRDDRDRGSSDVLLIGECSGSADLAFMARLTEGVLQSGRRVCYVARSGTESRRLRRIAALSGWGASFTLRDLPDLSTPLRFWMSGRARAHFERDLAALHDAARSVGAWLWSDAEKVIRAVAAAKASWESLAPDTGAIVTRTNYLPLSAVALADGARGNRLTATFQHSIVTCPASFVPLSSKRFVAFGDTSRELLGELDARFAAETGQPAVCREIVSAGSLTDEIRSLAPQREAQRVLFIDSGDGFAPRFFGAADQYAALAAAVRAVAERRNGNRSVVVRPHPRGGAGGWHRLAQQMNGAFEVSSGRSLTDDLASASVVAGLFSTVLPVAAACGRPAFILWQPGWFFTPDLAPFVERNFVAPSGVANRIDELLSDHETYLDACRTAASAGATYFKNGRSCEFGRDMVETLLAPL